MPASWFPWNRTPSGTMIAPYPVPDDLPHFRPRQRVKADRGTECRQFEHDGLELLRGGPRSSLDASHYSATKTAWRRELLTTVMRPTTLPTSRAQASLPAWSTR